MDGQLSHRPSHATQPAYAVALCAIKVTEAHGNGGLDRLDESVVVLAKVCSPNAESDAGDLVAVAERVGGEAGHGPRVRRGGERACDCEEASGSQSERAGLRRGLELVRQGQMPVLKRYSLSLFSANPFEAGSEEEEEEEQVEEAPLEVGSRRLGRC